ncbi:MAG: hypothetical protein LRZ92_02760 [Methanosarcinaceae archaeon]|jgi:multisubunit Na+/H+ antiporter MnhB subunit|nr:hypothetical protein [Methanosarcinaceae archaeon]NKQ38819.1 hypothetical protein [Methanosarcinales archaeon]
MKSTNNVKKHLGFASLLIIAIIFFIASTPFGLHPFGMPSEYQRLVDGYFIMHTINETGSFNIVTAILFDYRAFDTIGEATVLLTAITGCAAVLRGLKK